jgi:DNA-binding NtrC family response regulator
MKTMQLLPVPALKASILQKPIVEPSCHVLVIDDDQTVCQAFMWALQDTGCLVVAAPNLADALAGMASADFTPDAVMVDFHLDDQDLPAFIVTGDASASDLACTTAEDIRCLSKPLGYADLVRLIAEIRVRMTSMASWKAPVGKPALAIR